MNFLFQATAGPGDGLFPTQIDAYGLWNRTAGTVAVGDVLMIDLLASATAATTLDPGGSDSAFASVVVPSAGAEAATAPFVAAVVVGLGDVGTGAANTQVDVRIFGFADAFVLASSGSVAVGSLLIPRAEKNYDLVSGGAGELYAAIGNEAVTTPTTRALGEVFVGLNLMTHSVTAS